MIYSFREAIFQKDEVILKRNDPTDFLIIVFSGEVEVYLEIDDNIFVVERLCQGDVLNYRNIFFDLEVMPVSLRCSEAGALLFL